MLKAAQIEMLILQSVRQLVRHDRFLAVEIDPVSEMKLPRLWIVVAGDLFGQHPQHQGPVLKISGREAKLFQSDFVGAYARRRRVFIQTLDERALDLGAGLSRALHRTQNRELAYRARLFEDILSRGDEGGVAGVLLVRGRIKTFTAETQRAQGLRRGRRTCRTL